MRIFIWALVALALLFTIVNFTINMPQDSMHAEFVLNWTQRAVGGLITAVAGIVLLVKAVRQEPHQLGSLVAAALIGVIMMGSHWSIALSLVAVVIVEAVRAWFTRERAVSPTLDS